MSRVPWVGTKAMQKKKKYDYFMLEVVASLPS